MHFIADTDTDKYYFGIDFFCSRYIELFFAVLRGPRSRGKLFWILCLFHTDTDTEKYCFWIVSLWFRTNGKQFQEKAGKIDKNWQISPEDFAQKVGQNNTHHGSMQQLSSFVLKPRVLGNRRDSLLLQGTLFRIASESDILTLSCRKAGCATSPHFPCVLLQCLSIIVNPRWGGGVP